MLHRCGKIIYIIVYNLKFKRKMKRINLFVLLILATCGFVASCTDDDFANGGIGGNKYRAQNEAYKIEKTKKWKKSMNDRELER